MDDLLAFLAARLDEDEAAAHAALHGGSGRWERYREADLYDLDHRLVTTSGEFAHIIRHDPARVLREAEAKRAILARYEDCLARMEDPAYSGTAEYVQIREYEDFILPNLAAAWSDHPDCRPERKP